MIDQRQFYVEGNSAPPAEANALQVIDPSTAAPVAIISLGGQADTERAMAAARRAFPRWRARPASERAAWLERLQAR